MAFFQVDPSYLLPECLLLDFIGAKDDEGGEW